MATLTRFYVLHAHNSKDSLTGYNAAAPYQALDLYWILADYTMFPLRAIALHHIRSYGQEQFPTYKSLTQHISVKINESRRKLHLCEASWSQYATYMAIQCRTYTALTATSAIKERRRISAPWD